MTDRLSPTSGQIANYNNPAYGWSNPTRGKVHALNGLLLPICKTGIPFGKRGVAWELGNDPVTCAKCIKAQKP